MPTKFVDLTLGDFVPKGDEGKVVVQLEPSRTNLLEVRTDGEEVELDPERGVIEVGLWPGAKQGGRYRLSIEFEGETPAVRSASFTKEEGPAKSPTPWDLVSDRWSRLWSIPFERAMPVMFFTELEERSNPPVIRAAPERFPAPPGMDVQVRQSKCSQAMVYFHFWLMRRVHTNGEPRIAQPDEEIRRGVRFINEEIYFPLLSTYFGDYELPSGESRFAKIFAAFAAFSSGALREREGKELQSAQPSSYYYFLFAEHALHMRAMDPEHQDLWRSLASVFVATEHIFCHCYRPDRLLPRHRWYTWQQSHSVRHENDFELLRDLYRKLSWEQLEMAHWLNATSAFPLDRSMFGSVNDPDGGTDVVVVVPAMPTPSRSPVRAPLGPMGRIYHHVADLAGLPVTHLRPAHRLGRELTVDPAALLAALNEEIRRSGGAVELPPEAVDPTRLPFLQQIVDRTIRAGGPTA